MFAIYKTQSWRQSRAINAVSSKNCVLAFSQAASAAVKLASHPSSTDLGTHKSPSYLSSSFDVSTRAQHEGCELFARELQTSSQWFSMRTVSASGMNTDFGWVRGGSHSPLFLFCVKQASRQTMASGLQVSSEQLILHNNRNKPTQNMICEEILHQSKWDSVSVNSHWVRSEEQDLGRGWLVHQLDGHHRAQPLNGVVLKENAQERFAVSKFGVPVLMTVS